ncbi:MAG: hypothetical protein HYX78_12760 [Armatimonadetes bacterium]|nr:hypothetical protein [Armatimonadota bacterium]
MIFETNRFRISIDLQRGGKITELTDHRLARNLLFEEQADSGLPLEDGAVFSVSGWDEAVPSLEPCENVPTLGHAWRTHAVCVEGREHVTTCWSIPGWNLERKILLSDNGLTASYRMRNTSDKPSRLLWAAHALYPAEGLLRLVLPGGEPIPGPGHDPEGLSRQLKADGEKWLVSDFSSRGKSCKLFLPAHQEVVLHYKDAVLTIATDTQWFGIWLNLGRLAGCCVGIEPTNAPTDSLDQVRETVPSEEHFITGWSLQVDTMRKSVVE